MPLSANQIYFFVSYAVAFLVFGLIGKWYLWPAIRERAPGIALTPLRRYACVRVIGLMVRMPGLVSPQLPRAFAVPVAYGDLAPAPARVPRRETMGGIRRTARTSPMGHPTERSRRLNQ